MPTDPSAEATHVSNQSGETSRRRDLTFLVVMMVFPTFAAWVYFDLLSGQKWMLIAYGISKSIQFVAPILWILFVIRRRVSIREAPRRGFVLGIVSGLVIMALHLAVYYGYFRSSPVLAEAPEKLREKLVGMGGETPEKFFALALFISVIHSFLEEYYWRFFVYGELRRRMPFGLAVVISSLGFMAHHVIIINSYIPSQYFWTATMFFSVAVAVGGAIWAWVYEKTGALYAGWVSHVIVDIAVMITGYDLVFVKG